MAERSDSLLWFDYETFGSSTVWDRPTQFAALRTDLALQPIEAPVVLHCAPAHDYLPHPEACRLTGLDPITQSRRGLCEAAFITQVVDELGRPGTCSVGYNSIRFDDEISRHTLFRNFRDAYAHEWRDRNSRWDLIDVVRLTRALRPEGLHWPLREDGLPLNRLEALCAANGVAQSRAHDALSDVEATLALARLIRERQPRLFSYALEHRDRYSAMRLLDVNTREPVIEVSAQVPIEREHLGVVLPLARHPQQQNGIIVLDLQSDPDEILALPPDAIAERLFLPKEQAKQRLHLRTIRLNRCPVVVPLATLRACDAERLEIDLEQIRTRTQRTLELRASLQQHVQRAFQRDFPPCELDVDGTLYAGGFLDSNDQALSAELRQTRPELLASLHGRFSDIRLDELLFRYRARNFPQTLNVAEQQRWQRHIATRLGTEDTEWLNLQQFDALMSAQQWPAQEQALRDALLEWRQQCIDASGGLIG